MLRLFPRLLELEILDDTGAGVDLGALSCSFEISRLARGGLSLAKVTVRNLSKETTARIHSGSQIRLRAGYVQRAGFIFQGHVRNVFPTQEGPTRVVEIWAGDGSRDYRGAFVNAGFPSGSTLHGVVQTIAGAFVDAQLGPLDALTDQPLLGGRVVVGPAREALDALARSYDFVWWMEAGILRLADSGRAIGNQIIVISTETGMIGSPIASTTGLEVVTLLNSALLPGSLVDVRTAGARANASNTTLQTAQINLVGAEGGLYRVKRVDHVGESRGQAWYSRAECLPFEVAA